MAKINSRDKGARGERELAGILRSYGYNEARRGQQYNGIEGQDVVGLPGYHIEVKRVERLNVSNAIEQSVRDAEEDEVPIVAHRKNGEDWLVTLRLADFMEIIKEEEVK